MGKGRLFGGSDEHEHEAPPAPDSRAANVAVDADGVTAQRAASKQAVAQSLEQAPQAVKDAADKMGGEVPMAAPKGGEGVRVPPYESKVPELEPPPAPTEYRVAPAAPSELPERAGYGDKPKAEDLDVGARLRVRTVDPAAAPVYSGGVYVTRDGVELAVAEVRGRSEAHLAQLLADPRIEVELVS